MTIRFTILASGSTGNSLLVESEDSKVLVDAGLSAKKIEQLMNERGVSGSELDAILVTHEHSDTSKASACWPASTISPYTPTKKRGKR